jgi:hypothetical protein
LNILLDTPVGGSEQGGTAAQWQRNRWSAKKVKRVRETCGRVSFIHLGGLPSVNEIPCWIVTLLQSNPFSSLITAMATILTVWLTLRGGLSTQNREWDRRDIEAKLEQRARQKAAGRALAVELLNNHARLFSVFALAKGNKPASLPPLTRLQFDTQLPLIALLLDYKGFSSVVKAYSRLDYYNHLQDILERRELNRVLNPTEIQHIDEAMRLFDAAYQTVTEKVFTPEEIADLQPTAPP